MAILTAYFDACGAPGQLRNEVLVVGGFAAFEDNWIELNSRWNAALQNAGIQRFHMSDLIASSGEFKGWKGSDNLKAEFLGKLCRILVETVQFSFCGCVVLWDWQFVNLNYELAENDFQPYAIAGWSCVGRMRDWCSAKDFDFSQTRYIFEEGDLHQENIKRRVKRDLGIINQTQKKDSIPLQAADLGAWQVLNVMREHQRGRDFRETVPIWIVREFSKLFAGVEYDHSYFGMRSGKRGPALVRLCRDYQVAIRK